jgi:hypothetical protein
VQYVKTQVFRGDPPVKGATGAERKEAVEPSERTVGHPEVDARVEAVAAALTCSDASNRVALVRTIHGFDALLVLTGSTASAIL